MHVRTNIWTVAAGTMTCMAIFATCKARTADDRKGPPTSAAAAPTNAVTGTPGASMALFADWFKMDTLGENSGSPAPGAAGVQASLPPMIDVPQASIFMGTGRPEDFGVPLPTDPVGKICSPQMDEAFDGIQPLFCVPVPQPNKTDIVDQKAAIRLGKALFWDVQVGGDGKQACASCHYSAGADIRTMNTIHPGPNGLFEAPGVTGPGQDFSPFKNIDAPIDDRVGSQGVVGKTFKGVNPDPTVAADTCDPDQSAPFFAHRRVTGRNSPSVIGAVFNKFNFWDGRANANFNGFDPFGATGNATNKQTLFTNGSLASQSVGPPNNGTEMSCAGRPFNGPNSLASKMLARQPLQFQVVSPGDSVLGNMSNSPGKGLNCYGAACTYSKMVGDAFGAQWIPLATDNFSRLWGQALQAYISTLIPDQTRFDQYRAGKTTLFTPLQAKGFDVFVGAGQCSDCHSGSEMTDASFNYGRSSRREDQGNDEGFHNLGVSRTDDDLGRGGTGPLGATWASNESLFNRGAFKTPGLRNLKLTAPYFHNGGKATIEDVVDFYAHRGGDVANPELSTELQQVSIENEDDQTALVEFLRNGLLDCRVEKYRAPFDHPQIDLPNGVSLPATGLTGIGSCRLDPKVPPTTVNCIRTPSLCDSNNGLLATSLFKDLMGRLPTDTEAKSFRSMTSTAALAFVKSMLGSKDFMTGEISRISALMLGRAADAKLLASPSPSVSSVVHNIGASAEYFAKAGSTNNGFLNQLMLDFAGRKATAAELQQGINLITKNGRGSALDAYYVSVAARTKRVGDWVRRYLRRDPDAATIATFLRIPSDTDANAGLLMGQEYKDLAAARDDI